MYLDFEDHRPETPRVPSAISVREGVLLSLVFHLTLALAIVLFPRFFLRSPAAPVAPVPRDQPPLRFVEVLPLNDKSLAPLIRTNPSDMDRRSATRESAPDPDNTMPFSRGNTSQLIEGGPKVPPPQPPAAAPTPPSPAVQPSPSAAPPSADASLSQMTVPVPTPPSPAAPPRQASRALADSLRNLQQYLRNENYDNIRGGNADQSADIQFDSMGVDFGPWLRRFKNQVERNWIVPTAAMTYRGRVVIQFNVLRNGTITDLNVVQPAGYPSLTSSALNALKLSNPTSALPPEYPAERVFFTVTFHYNEEPRSAP
jgi:TonB family protein